MNEHELIDKYVGCFYKHGGRDLSGLDCYGLIIRWFEDLGYRIWDINEEYTEDWSFAGKDYFIENYHKEWRISDDPKLHDVALFRIRSNRNINHAGIVLSYGKFIHACRLGVIVSKLNHPQWQKRLAGVYRLKEMENDQSKIHSEHSRA